MSFLIALNRSAANPNASAASSSEFGTNGKDSVSLGFEGVVMALFLSWLRADARPVEGPQRGLNCLGPHHSVDATIKAETRSRSEMPLWAYRFNSADPSSSVNGAGDDQRRLARRRKRWQRKLARRCKGGKNRAKARRQVAKTYRSASDVRRDLAHKAARVLVDDPRHQVYTIEKLAVRNMTTRAGAKPDPERPNRRD